MHGLQTPLTSSYPALQKHDEDPAGAQELAPQGVHVVTDVAPVADDEEFAPQRVQEVLKSLVVL